MKIKDIINYLESIAPLSYQESFDNSGLLTGDENWKVNGVLVTLDCIEEVVEEAILKQCNLIIAHHPIIFEGIKKLNGKNYAERTVIKAIQNNIAIYSAHTNFDNINIGINFKISEKLKLINCKILSPKYSLLKKLVTFCPAAKAEIVRQSLFNAGAGNIGKYNECSFNTIGTGTFKASETASPYVGEIGIQHQEEEIKIECIFPVPLQNNIIKALLEVHPYEEVAYDIYSLDNTYTSVGSGMVGELENEEDELLFLSRVKEVMNAGCIRYTQLLNRKVKKVAICGGAGSFLLKDAISAESDVFITSDFKYHQFFDAEKKIVIADIGHFESEQYTKELFYDFLNKKFSTFVVYLSEINSNPINYL